MNALRLSLELLRHWLTLRLLVLVLQIMVLPILLLSLSAAANASEDATALRVVTLSNDSTEALLALGLKPVGATRSLNGQPWYPHIAQQMQGVTVVGLETPARSCSWAAT